MKKILLMMFALLYGNVYSQSTITSAQSGDWNATGTWVGSTVPSNGDNIVVDDSHDVTLNVTGVSINSLTIDVDGSLVVDNALTISGGANSSIQGELKVRNTVTVSAGNMTILTNAADAPFTPGKITVNAGKSLIFSNSATVLTNNGQLVIQSDSQNFGSVLFKGTAAYTGLPVVYNRFITGISTTGVNNWNTISSPVKFQQAAGIVSQTNLASNGSGASTVYGIGDYDNTSGANGVWDTFSETEADDEGSLTPGKGYQMVTDGTGSTIAFTGRFNDNSLSIAISEADNAGDAASATGTRWNLIGNPYTAYLSANVNASGASSFGSNHLLKTSNLNILHTNNQAIYVFNGSSYTTIGTSTSAASAVVAPGQAFMVGGKHDDGSTSFSFSTNMLTEDGSDDGFVGDPMEDNRAELFISLNQSDIDRRTEIYFLDDGSDAFTSADAGGIDFNYNSIYSRVVSGENDVDLAIQTLAFSEMTEKVIPIGLNVTAGEEMKISISHNTTPADLNVYLEDALEGTMTDLKAGDFTLTPSDSLDGVGRFFIHTTADTMSNGEVSTSMLNAYKEVNANYITLEGLATQTNNINVSLYNILGRKVLDTSLNNNVNTQTISTIGMSSGIYVIELESGNDRLTKKLIIQ